VSTVFLGFGAMSFSKVSEVTQKNEMPKIYIILYLLTPFGLFLAQEQFIKHFGFVERF
jgi:hypothetical protein